MSHSALLRLPEVIRRCGLGRSSLYRLIHEGEFPTPVKLGPRAVAWVESDVEDWIRARIAASRSAA